MAAIAYPLPLARRSAQPVPRLRVVRDEIDLLLPRMPVELPRVIEKRELDERRVRRVRLELHKARVAQRKRTFVAMATIAMLVGMWFGTGAIVGTRSAGFVRLPGSVATSGGYVYTVRAGDTLWSIATALDPTGDPRALVTRLSSEIGGGTLQAGMKLWVP